MTLLCDASGGNPNQYQYTWIFVPKYGGGNITYLNQNSVENPSITYKSAGLYICNASNPGGDVNTETKITIHCKRK